jgi:uncharacterized membrane protein
VNAIQKLLSSLKNVLPQSTSRVSVEDLPSFTQNLMQTTLLNFAIHCRQNET